MNDQTTTYPIGKADRGALRAFDVLGALIALAASVFSVIRIVEVLGTNASVSVSLNNVQQTIDIEGFETPAMIDQVTLIVDKLTGFALTAALIEPILIALTTITIVLCLILLGRRIARGQAFGRSSTAIVATASITGFIGFSLAHFFGSMAGVGALADLSEGEAVSSGAFIFEPGTFIVSAFILALITTAFSVGSRLQRDAEGLV